MTVSIAIITTTTTNIIVVAAATTANRAATTMKVRSHQSQVQANNFESAAHCRPLSVRLVGRRLSPSLRPLATPTMIHQQQLVVVVPPSPPPPTTTFQQLSPLQLTALNHHFHRPSSLRRWPSTRRPRLLIPLHRHHRLGTTTATVKRSTHQLRLVSTFTFHLKKGSSSSSNFVRTLYCYRVKVLDITTTTITTTFTPPIISITPSIVVPKATPQRQQW